MSVYSMLLNRLLEVPFAWDCQPRVLFPWLISPAFWLSANANAKAGLRNDRLRQGHYKGKTLSLGDFGHLVYKGDFI